MNTKQQIKRTLSAALFAVMVLASSSLFAQVKIGSNPTTIAAGSALEVEATDKGIRLPQVALTSTVVFAPVAGVGTASTSPGMTVYNTNAGIVSGVGSNGNRYNGFGVGEYYWDGFGWVSKNASKGYRLIWAGTSAGPYNYLNNAGFSYFSTTEVYDSENSSASGVFTAPYDAFYTITQALKVKFNGPITDNGSFQHYTLVTPLATGVEEQRNRTPVAGLFTYLYSSSQTITLSLKAGDKVRFGVAPCLGCVAGTSYDLTSVDQTIAVFQ